MGRYFIEISYNGANYSGWQTQTNAHSVQAELQNVCRKVLKQEIIITGSSRTDAGVHAKRQVAQLDFEPFDELDQHIFKLNMALPNDIAVRSLRLVKPESQCRFDALSRTYQYLISRKKDPFFENRSLFWYGELNVDLMNDCCKLIQINNDFQAFSKVKTSVNNFHCQILKAFWEKDSDLLIFEIEANRFLRGMVRALVGTMLEVGKGRKSVSDFEEILHSKNRKLAGESITPFGLYLTRVSYPTDIYL